MEPGAINAFLDQFLSLADQGFGLVRGDVVFVLNALIVISIVLAGVQWTLGGEAPMAPFFRKVLYVGLFAFLINNWEALSLAINQSGAMLGLRAGGSTLALADLSNPGRVAGIGGALFGRTVALGEGMNILTDFIPLATIFLAGLFVLIGFYILALQIFVTMIAFKLGALVAFIALPWGVFSGTTWIAERPIGWVVGCAVRLFVLAFIASVSIAFVDASSAALTIDAGGALNILLFGATVMALAWFGPALASEVVQGQPHLSAGDVVGAGSGAALGLAAAGAGAAYGIAGGMALGGRALGAIARALPMTRASGAGGPKPGGPGGAAGTPGAATSSGAINYAGMKPKPAAPPPGGARPDGDKS